MAKLNGAFVPLYSILMTGQKQNEYVDVFEWVKNDLGLAAGTFVSVKTDYEKGLRNAIKCAWPDSKVTGCYFHFCQALYRHMCKLGLQTAFMKKKSRFRVWLRHLMCIANLQVDDILQEWAVLSKSDVEGLNSNEKVQFLKFKEYFRKFWICQTGPSNFSFWGQDDRCVIFISFYFYNFMNMF